MQALPREAFEDYQKHSLYLVQQLNAMQTELIALDEAYEEQNPPPYLDLTPFSEHEAHLKLIHDEMNTHIEMHKQDYEKLKFYFENQNPVEKPTKDDIQVVSPDDFGKPNAAEDVEELQRQRAAAVKEREEKAKARAEDVEAENQAAAFHLRSKRNSLDDAEKKRQIERQRAEAAREKAERKAARKKAEQDAAEAELERKDAAEDVEELQRQRAAAVKEREEKAKARAEDVEAENQAAAFHLRSKRNSLDDAEKKRQIERQRAEAAREKAERKAARKKAEQDAAEAERERKEREEAAKRSRTEQHAKPKPNPKPEPTTTKPTSQNQPKPLVTDVEQERLNKEEAKQLLRDYPNFLRDQKQKIDKLKDGEARDKEIRKVIAFRVKTYNLEPPLTYADYCAKTNKCWGQDPCCLPYMRYLMEWFCIPFSKDLTEKKLYFKLLVAISIDKFASFAQELGSETNRYTQMTGLMQLIGAGRVACSECDKPKGLFSGRSSFSGFGSGSSFGGSSFSGSRW